MFLLYNAVLTLFSPFWVPWMLWRTAKRKEKPNWAERQGNLPLKPDKSKIRVWIHAVSVGEVMACLPVIQELKRERPNVEILLSVTTSSGHQTARDRAIEFVDHLVYFPLDVARFQLNAMQRVQPKVVAIMETELWFNFLWAAKIFDAKTMLVNGRISDRSYPRSRKLRFFYKPLLGMVDRCLMQTSVDAERIRALGAAEPEVFGNCKFDQAVEGISGNSAEWRVKLHLREDLPILVVGSTRGEEEESLVLDAINEIGLDRIQVIHAPRHLESVSFLAAAAEAKLGEVGLRSQGQASRYLILDTYGELGEIYGVADIVVIGGGFGNFGGQNILQPLAHGKPVLHGPHMQNFADVAHAAGLAGATIVCSNAKELAHTIDDLLANAVKRSEMGEKAKAFIKENLGASKRYAQAIIEALS